MKLIRRQRTHSPGQALLEFGLVLPLFLMALMGVIVLGMIVFYNQQLTNAAREAARFASVSSATAQCSVVSTLDPVGSGLTFVDPLTGHQATWDAPTSYAQCDRPQDGWPKMTTFAQSKVFGLNAGAVRVAACWSGYRTATHYDAPPPGNYAVQGNVQSTWAQCTIGGADPTTNPSAIGCAPALATVDKASDMSEGQGRVVANRVTAYACYEWNPPMAGFLLIPKTVTLRAVISEPIQRQQ